MNPERKEFLSLFPTPPARVATEEAAWLLGFAPHDISVLVSAGLLKPLGHPPASGTKYFATATLLKLRDDLNWLSRASDTIVRHWQTKNVRKSKKQIAPAVRPHDQPQTQFASPG
ncbi:MAG: hypothetical protein ACREDQ_07755 [Limisphaerales bacterium]